MAGKGHRVDLGVDGTLPHLWTGMVGKGHRVDLDVDGTLQHSWTGMVGESGKVNICIYIFLKSVEKIFGGCQHFTYICRKFLRRCCD